MSLDLCVTRARLDALAKPAKGLLRASAEMVPSRQISLLPRANVLLD